MLLSLLMRTTLSVLFKNATHYHPHLSLSLICFPYLSSKVPSNLILLFIASLPQLECKLQKGKKTDDSQICENKCLFLCEIWDELLHSITVTRFDLYVYEHKCKKLILKPNPEMQGEIYQDSKQNEW